MKSKPTIGWALMDKNTGRINYFLYRTKKEAKVESWADDIVIKVEVREVK